MVSRSSRRAATRKKTSRSPASGYIERTEARCKLSWKAVNSTSTGVFHNYALTPVNQVIRRPARRVAPASSGGAIE